MDGSGTADRVDRAALSPGVSTAGATYTRQVDPLTVTQRLQREGRWAGQIEFERDEMMKLARTRGMSKSAAQLWTYAELDRMYPPPSEKGTMPPDGGGPIQGLGDIPPAWPDLPDNASLAVEVGWVQANRLRIVTEQASGATIVHLSRSLSPAPSWAALGWLETSIRSYAKYVDVAAKATASDDGEAAVMRRERMAIEEMEALLAEMMPPDACPECGRTGN